MFFILHAPLQFRPLTLVPVLPSFVQHRRAMAFNENDEKLREVSDAIEDTTIDALKIPFKDPEPDDGPRQSFFGRWMGFLSIMFLLGLLVGVLAVVGTYMLGTPKRTGPNRLRDTPGMTQEQWNVLERRIAKNAVIGFVVGAGLGGMYVVKCLVRGVDP
jgi:hypothetical protein